MRYFVDRGSNSALPAGRLCSLPAYAVMAIPKLPYPETALPSSIFIEKMPSAAANTPVKKLRIKDFCHPFR
jgi:hypothetical protein